MGERWDALQGAIDGEVVLPDSPRYDQVRRAAVTGFEQVRPAAVVRCRTAPDVAEAIRYADGTGSAVAIRSGGHCFAGRSSTDGILIDVGSMAGVSVADGAATIGAGAQLGAVYEALGGHRLTLAAGCGPTVGIAGLTLGGGIGVLGRQYGVTSDRLLGAEVVLADGRVVACDEQRDADLFWALRGAGACGFGVVTSLTFRPVPDTAMASFLLTWPIRDAVAVAAAWQELAPVAPDELAASVLMTVTAGSATVQVLGAMVGTESDAVAQLDALTVRAGVEPASAEVLGHATVAAAKHQLAQREGAAGRPYCTSEYFGRSLPADALAGLVAHLTRDASPGHVRELDFMPLGGAYNRVPAGATGYVHRDDRFLLKYGVVVDPGAPEAEPAAARRWLARSAALALPWGSGRAYQNFPEPDAPLFAPAYYGTNLDRLRRVKHAYDPSGLLGS
jgi:FAD/FMN-containing dehydrogenase